MKSKLVLSIFIVCAFLVLAVGSSDSDSSGSSTATSGEMFSLSSKCLGASSEEAYDRMIKLVNAKDDTGLTQLMLAGYVRACSAGETGKVIDVGFLKTEVRFDGEYTTWYVPTEFVKAY